MRVHRSLQPDELFRRGPQKMALMVASEFYRASSGSDYRDDVIACYDRARELMGVLETFPLGPEAGSYLKPYYSECRKTELLRDDRLTPDYVKTFGVRLAEAFEKAAEMIAREEPRA